MPVAFDLDPQARLVRSRAWGVVDEAELMGHVVSMRSLFAGGTLDADWAQVADFSDCTSLESLSSAGVRRLAENNPWPVGAVRVFIAPQELIFGLVRMYQSLADLERMHVVRSMADARAWMAQQGHPIDAPQQPR